MAQARKGGRELEREGLRRNSKIWVGWVGQVGGITLKVALMSIRSYRRSNRDAKNSRADAPTQ